MLRATITALALTLIAPHAHALPCWEAPKAACFEAAWTDAALTHAQGEPRAQHIYDLINWGVTPKGTEASRALLDGLTYDMLVRYERALNPDGIESGVEALFPEGTDAPSFDLAMLLMMGFFNTPADAPEVDPHYIMAIYNIALASGDAALAEMWRNTLPDYLRNSPEIIPMDATAPDADPFLAGQAGTVQVISALKAGDTAAARGLADGLTGEPGFFAWLHIARAAIAAQDMPLLDEAVAGMELAARTPLLPEFSEEEFENALKAAEVEFAATGDPDALVHVYEGMDPSAYALRPATQLTISLAARYHALQTGAPPSDDFEQTVAVMATQLRDRVDEDDATLMRNARTALALGMEDEADMILDMVFEEFPGVPYFVLYHTANSPVTEAWLDRILTRYRALIRAPDAFVAREYWGIWLDQDALGEAIWITRHLARFGRHEEAERFATEAEAYLASLPGTYPEYELQALDGIFRSAVTVHLASPDDAIARMRANGLSTTAIAYELAEIGQFSLALEQVAGPVAQGDLRNLQHWMKQVDRVPEGQQATYIAQLDALIPVEIDRLYAAGYPGLVQELRHDAAVYAAGLGNWTAAKAYYEAIETVDGKYGPSPAIRGQMQTLRALTELLRGEGAARPAYPYEDFAL